MPSNEDVKTGKELVLNYKGFMIRIIFNSKVWLNLTDFKKVFNTQTQIHTYQKSDTIDFQMLRSTVTGRPVLHVDVEYLEDLTLPTFMDIKEVNTLVEFILDEVTNVDLDDVDRLTKGALKELGWTGKQRKTGIPSKPRPKDNTNKYLNQIYKDGRTHALFSITTQFIIIGMLAIHMLRH